MCVACVKTHTGKDRDVLEIRGGGEDVKMGESVNWGKVENCSSLIPPF